MNAPGPQRDAGPARRARYRAALAPVAAIRTTALLALLPGLGRWGHGRRATREGPLGSRLLRRARPERRQHPVGAGLVRHRREPAWLGAGDVRPRPCDADTGDHRPGVRWLPHPGRDLV